MTCPKYHGFCDSFGAVECGGEMRQYAIPNGANYCTSFVRDVKEDERRMREKAEEVA